MKAFERCDERLLLETHSSFLALQLMQDFDGDAALVAWGRADVEADCGHFDLCHKWIDVMDIILVQTANGRRNQG